MDLFQTTIPGGWSGSCNLPTPANVNWASSPWENSSGKTWSQITSKGVQQSAVRPKNYDSSNATQSHWAGPQSVDQGTPWGGGGGGGADSAVKQNEWSNQQNSSTPTVNWENNGAKANSWQTPAQKPNKPSVSSNGADYWQKGAGRSSTSQSSNQWQEPAAGGSGWDSLPPPSNRWSSDAPQACVPSNVWTGPPSAQDSVVDSSMIWNNPNPKKVIQPDKGTGVWGDPTSQIEIKRWRASSDESGSSPGSGQQQQQQTVGVGQQLQTPSSSSVWQDSPIAPNGQKLSSAASWSDQQHTGTQDGSASSAQAANGTALWDAAEKTVPSSTWGGNNAWTPSNPNDTNRQSSGNVNAGVVEEGLCDEVFSSNPTTPLTPRGPLRNGTPSNLPANYSVVAQQLQQPTQATGRPMQSNQLLQTLSKHIADQLRSAVQAGMIDISILCQPLSQESLLQLNQLLQIVPKLEQAQSELQSLQNLQRQGDRLNETQSQEVKRLMEDVGRYNVMIQQIKQQINNKTRQSGGNVPNGSSNADVLSAINGADPSLLGSQSKLMQWSKSAGNGVDQKLSVSSSAPNLEQLEQNMTSLAIGSAASNAAGDLWSNKRHSGSDWPSSTDSSNEFLMNALGAWGRGDSQTDELRQNFPPEFKPGHPWEWRDPNKMAEDPNATPGSINPSALNKFNLDSTSGFPNFSNLPNMNYGVQSSLYGSTTPTKLMNFDMKPTTISPSFNCADQYNMMPRYSRPPSQIGQPYGGRPQMMKQQPFATPNNFMPYTNNMSQWVVLTNLSQIDERSLQATVNRFGTPSTAVSPPGSGFVFLKFLESSFERILPRMQQALAPFGVTVQIMKESEVERLLQVLNNRPASTMFTNSNNSSIHLPPPPPHHSLLWDAPPPNLLASSNANTGVHASPYALAPEMPAQDAAAAFAHQQAPMPPMQLNQIVM